MVCGGVNSEPDSPGDGTKSKSRKDVSYTPETFSFLLFVAASVAECSDNATVKDSCYYR